MTDKSNSADLHGQAHVIPALEQLRHTPHVCFAENIRSANRAVTRRYARHLEAGGLTGVQSSVLTRLYYIGPVTVARLAIEMETDRTTMVRNIALLEKSGHVIVRAASSGGRTRLIHLTDKGLAALEEIMPGWQRAQEELRAALGPESWDAMMEGLRRLVELEGLAAPRGRSGDA